MENLKNCVFDNFIYYYVYRLRIYDLFVFVIKIIIKHLRKAASQFISLGVISAALIVV